MRLRTAKIAATNDRCPSCPPRHFPLFASPESDYVHLPKKSITFTNCLLTIHPSSNWFLPWRNRPYNLFEQISVLDIRKTIEDIISYPSSIYS